MAVCSSLRGDSDCVSVPVHVVCVGGGDTDHIFTLRTLAEKAS